MKSKIIRNISDNIDYKLNDYVIFINNINSKKYFFKMIF